MWFFKPAKHGMNIFYFNSLTILLQLGAVRLCIVRVLRICIMFKYSMGQMNRCFIYEEFL